MINKKCNYSENGFGWKVKGIRKYVFLLMLVLSSTENRGRGKVEYCKSTHQMEELQLDHWCSDGFLANDRKMTGLAIKKITCITCSG